jgi:hypothetical protein
MTKIPHLKYRSPQQFINTCLPNILSFQSKVIYFRAILILDNAPGDPQFIADIYPNINITFLPSNTRYLPQPKDQDVLVYLRHAFPRPPEHQNKDVQPFSNSGRNLTFKMHFKISKEKPGRRSKNSTIVKSGKNFALISLKI